MATERTLRGTGGFAALIVSTVLVLCLAGCGGQQAASSSVSDSASGASQEAAESNEMVLPEDVAEVAEATKAAMENADTSKAEDLSALPSREDEAVEELDGDEVEVGIEDESKAPAGSTLLHTGGIQALIPSSWLYAVSADGWDLMSRDGSVYGFMYAVPISSVPSTDVQGMAASIPQNLSQSGFSDIEVISFSNKYSSSGKLCSSYISVAGVYGGQLQIVYYEYVLSKSYVNMIGFCGQADDFKAYISDLESITDSLAFNRGEEI